MEGRLECCGEYYRFFFLSVH